ncbi:hypothetical protein OS493_027083 [Desmophyllum pertusum]|uniref:Uncharacterized protein n=1 Tax=Desmophyllum pertusum TaxID=174260 RepID=A0A9W9Y9H3_9CNID|nr:hypothetical protein OS493_027083 [Desmophyllum pertusum]
MVILIIIVLITKRKKLVPFFKWARCRPICWSSGDAELSRDTESSFIDDVKAQLNVVPKGVLISLSELKSLSLVTYDKVWKRLDKQPEGSKKGDFRDVAEAFMFVQ